MEQLETSNYSIWNDGFFITLIAEYLPMADLNSFAQTNKIILSTIYQHFERKHSHFRIKNNLAIKRKQNYPESINQQISDLAHKMGKKSWKSNEHNWYMADSTIRLLRLHDAEKKTGRGSFENKVLMLRPIFRWLEFIENVKQRKLSIFFDIPGTYFTDSPSSKYYYFDGAWIHFRVLVGPTEYGHRVFLKMIGCYWEGFKEFELKWLRNKRLSNGLEVEEWNITISHDAYSTSSWYPYVDFLSWFEAEVYVCDSEQRQAWDDNFGDYFHFHNVQSYSYQCGQIIRH